MEIDTARLKSYFALPEEIQHCETKSTFRFLEVYFKDLYASYTEDMADEDPEQALKIQVLNELAVNILRDLHQDLKLNDQQMRLAITFIFKNIATGLKDDLDVDQIHSNFKADLLKYIADQVWVNKKIFTKEEVMGLYTIFYDNFLDYVHIYMATLGKKHVLHFDTFDATNVSMNTPLVDLKLFELADKSSFAFLDVGGGLGLTQSEAFLKTEYEQTVDDEFAFTIMTKEELRNAKTLKDKELKIQLIVEKEKARIDQQYEEKLKELNIK